MVVSVDEDLGLEYPRQFRLVDEVEVWGCKMLICKFSQRKNIVRMGNH